MDPDCSAARPCWQRTRLILRGYQGASMSFNQKACHGLYEQTALCQALCSKCCKPSFRWANAYAGRMVKGQRHRDSAFAHTDATVRHAFIQLMQLQNEQRQELVAKGAACQEMPASITTSMPCGRHGLLQPSWAPHMLIISARYLWLHHFADRLHCISIWMHSNLLEAAGSI